jgi:threonine dehydrogenase-like Zn-dependent dehydrogenase
MYAGESMRAAVIEGPGKVRVESVQRPTPRRAELRVKLQGCGVCASNLATWAGMPWTEYPTEPGGLGHEGWGILDAMGEDSEGFQIGDRVALVSQHAYAEFDVAPQAAVVKLPSALDNSAFPGEPLGCAMNIFCRSQISAGETVAIVGIGFLGAVLTRLASNAGARVIAISRRPCSLEVARRMGAVEAIPLLDHRQIIEAVVSLNHGKLCDCVIEAVGKQWPLTLAAELVRERGRLIIAGYHQDGPRQINMQLWNWKGLDVMNAHERELEVYAAGIRRAVDAVANNLFDPSSLLTHRFPLEQLGAALDATRDRPEGFMKALIVYE